ncbi:hypothetical protein BDW74DRAFT_172913 [Aspergillus multicolor]|uniref:uncharacterized protein n=1 Tax=Aspergillus multicolor TaxID=41759 RepID=UPI003CCD8553
MIGTLHDFVLDIYDHGVPKDNFYQGLSNLWEQVVVESRVSYSPELFDVHRLRQDLPDQPELFGALCYRELIKHPALATHVSFSYRLSRREPDNISAAGISMTLVRGLGVLTWAIDKPANETVSRYQHTFRREKAENDLIAAALFVARTRKQLELLDDIECGGSTREDEIIQATLWPSFTEWPSDTNDKTSPLGDVITRLYGHELGQDGDWESCQDQVGKWFFLLRGDHSQRLQPHLSLEQTSTARILLEWWDGSTDFEVNIECARVAVRQLTQGYWDGKGFLTGSNGYQDIMQWLWTREFLLPGSRGPAMAHNNEFSKLAAAQRLAMAVCRSLDYSGA